MHNRDDVRIREFVQKLAHAAPPAPPFPDPTLLRTPSAPPVREPLGWGPKIGFAAAAVLFLVVPFFVFTGGTPPGVPDAPGATPSTAIPVEIFRYPTTDYQVVQDGFVSGSFVVPDPQNPRLVSAVVARVDDTGFEGAISINVNERDPGWPVLGELVTSGRRDMRVFRDSGSVTLSWDDGDRFVWVMGDEETQLRDLLVIGGSVTLADGEFGPATLTIGDLPDGYSILATSELRSNRSEPTLTLGGPPTEAIFPRTPPNPIVMVEVNAETHEQIAGRFPSGSRAVVRSLDGFLVSRGDSAAYVWEEYPGLTVTVSGSAPTEQLLAVAESLEFVSESQWRAIYDVPESQPALPTTTIITIDSTTTMVTHNHCQSDQINTALGTSVSDIQGPAQVVVISNIGQTDCLLERPVSLDAVLESGGVSTGSFGVSIRHHEPDQFLAPGESVAVVYEVEAGCQALEPANAIRLEMTNALVVEVPFTGELGCLRFGLLAPWSDGQLGFDDGQPEPSAEQRDLVELLMAFAVNPTPANLSKVPLSDSVVLTAGPDIAKTVATDELMDPAAWALEAEEFRGGTGPVSVLAALRGLHEWEAGFEVTIGPHSHCASPSQPRAAGLGGLTQVSIQSVATESCLQWWVVDLFVDESDEIVGITYDLWEP